MAVPSVKTMKMIQAYTYRLCNLSGTKFFEAMNSVPHIKYIIDEPHDAYQIARIPIRIVVITSSPFILIIQIFCRKFCGSKTQCS
jgi:hypothetical protein